MASPEERRTQDDNGQRQVAGDGRMAPEERGAEEGRVQEGARAMRSLASHFADLTREVSTLVRDETALARAELSEDVAQLKRGSTSLAIGGALAFGGVLFLLAAVAAALAIVWPLWLSALVVGVVALILGGAGALLARRWSSPESLKPTRTIESGRSIGRTTKEALR